jgi:hypothetical protein
MRRMQSKEGLNRVYSWVQYQCQEDLYYK